MLDPDVRRLLDGTSLAHLATVLPDGAPHSVPVWVDPEGDRIAILTGPDSRKARNLRCDPRVALSISETDDGRADPFTLMRVTIRGEAQNLKDDLSMKDPWLARFPEQAINFTLADFSFWRIVPRDARFVAGFGRIHNLSAADLTAAAA